MFRFVKKVVMYVLDKVAVVVDAVLGACEKVCVFLRKIVGYCKKK